MVDCQIRPSQESVTDALQLRQATAADAREFSAWMVRDLPVSPELALALPSLLSRLIREEALGGACVRDCKVQGGEGRLAAFGISGFISEECASTFLREPIPHFELTLLERARVPGTGPGLLSLDEIAAGNGGDGLTLFPLLWLQRSTDVADPETHELLELGQQAFLRLHRGYRIKRIVKEAAAERAQAYVAGGFRERRRIPAGTPFSGRGGVTLRERIVFVTTRDDIRSALPGTAIGPLFSARRPRCAFTRGQQKVLEGALDNMTDREIASALGITAIAVALRWRKIYEKMEAKLPFAALPVGEGARGNEKRRRVLAYIAEHPEELRPYAGP
jgi:hypothetical protein